MEILGIDIGGSGIKAAIVDSSTGELISERYRVPTPQPSTPDSVAEEIKGIVEHFGWKGICGVSFPMVIANGKALYTSNIDANWQNCQVDKLFSESTGLTFFVINDADAAGIAEMEFGAGKGKEGIVIVITIGTGLGSGFFHNGALVPNVELGRIFGKNGKPIEYYAADSARKRKDLTWDQWGKRFNFFLTHIERTFSPDLFILGGGASKKLEKYRDQLEVGVPITVAEKLNNAGIVGAALFAANQD